MDISVSLENTSSYTPIPIEYNLTDKSEWNIGYSKNVESVPDIVLSNKWRGICGHFSETDGYYFFIPDKDAKVIYMKCHEYNNRKRYEYPRLLNPSDVCLLHDGDVFIFKKGERLVVKSSEIEPTIFIESNLIPIPDIPMQEDEELSENKETDSISDYTD